MIIKSKEYVLLVIQSHVFATEALQQQHQQWVSKSSLVGGPTTPSLHPLCRHPDNKILSHFYFYFADNLTTRFSHFYFSFTFFFAGTLKQGSLNFTFTFNFTLEAPWNNILSLLLLLFTSQAPWSKIFSLLLSLLLRRHPEARFSQFYFYFHFAGTLKQNFLTFTFT